WRLDLMATLRGAVPSKRRAGAMLVAAGGAMALMLLVGAGLLLESLFGLERRYLGFHPPGVLRAPGDPPPPRHPEPSQRAAAFSEIERRIAGLPGVEAVGIAAPQLFPFGGPAVRGAVFEREGRPGGEPRAEVYAANPAYLRSVKLPLLRGRWFTET